MSENSPVRFEREKPPFTCLENAILDDARITKTYTKMVYWVICRHANSEGEAWPSLKRIALQAGCSVSSVQLALAELEKLGYILKIRRYRQGTRELTSNLYAIPAQYEYRNKVYRHTVNPYRHTADVYCHTADGIPPDNKEQEIKDQEASKNKKEREGERPPSPPSLLREKVCLSPTEYNDLIKEYPRKLVDWYIGNMDDKLVMYGRSYRDIPAAIRKWIREDIQLQKGPFECGPEIDVALDTLDLWEENRARYAR